MRRITAGFLAFLMTFLLTTSAFAADQTQTVDCGDGYYLVIHTVEQSNLSRASSTHGTKYADVMKGTTQIGRVSITGYFAYDGTKAKATSASTGGYGLNGWSYKSGDYTMSGATITGTFVLSKSGLNQSFSFDMYCTPNGTIK